jgi:hypothetical protein
MAGQITISTLRNDTGVLATQNGMTGIAKAWVNFNGTGGTIRSSFNVSSITVNGTGDYTVNFTTAMPDANYVVAGSARYDNSGVDYNSANFAQYRSAYTTSAFRIFFYGRNQTSGAPAGNPEFNHVIVLGN